MKKNPAIHLILLPGLDGTGDLFAPLLKRIAAMKIAAGEPEFIAHALQYPTHEQLGFRALNEMVEYYLATQLPADAVYVLLGESFSGPIAVAVAHAAQTALDNKAPDERRCLGLILCCTFVRNPFSVFAPLGPLWSLAPLELVPMSWVNRLAQGKLDFWSDQGELAMAQLAPDVLRYRLKIISKVDVSRELSELRLPILYLQASKDLIVPASAARLVQELAPQTDLVRIEGSHFLLQSKPAAALAHMQQFIAQNVVDDCAFSFPS